MSISGHTKPFAVLGHPIGHTLSPVMHNEAFAALEWDAIYLAFNVKPEDLMTTLHGMRNMGFVGANLTIPHKEIAFSELSDLDASAKLVGAVNTVKFSEDGITGYSTDGHGFLKAVETEFGMDVKGKSVAVLGTGGAGRTVALTCAQEGVASLSLTDLDEQRTQKLADELRAQFSEVGVDVSAGDVATADLVVHATPVGMKKDDEAILGPEAFTSGQCVIDLIYMYPETAIMRSATQGGARCANGLGMLLHQGAKSFEIWTGTEPPVDRMQKVLETAVYGS